MLMMPERKPTAKSVEEVHVSADEGLTQAIRGRLLA